MGDPENRQLQFAELEALESVLKAKKVQKLNNWLDDKLTVKGFIQIDFDSISGGPIELKGVLRNADDGFSCIIKFLPPARLVFELPFDYPSSAPPKLNLVNEWMTEAQIGACSNALTEVCSENPGMIVLYYCYASVIETVEKMSIDCIDLNFSHLRALHPMLSVRELRNRILQAVDEINGEVFANQMFECQICFDILHGIECFQFLPCEHVSCKNCVMGYYRSLANGLISNPFKCLSEGCKTEAQQQIIQEALGDELFAKYDAALLEKAISEIGDTMECAIERCKMIAYITDKDKNLVQCSYCGYNFCKLCKQTYHGVSPCKITRAEMERILAKYEEGNEEERAELRKKYGEKELEEWVTNMLNSRWVTDNTKTCPGCSVPIEKSEGCNKMHCSKCSTTFCWLCQKAISNGYAHFNGGTCDGRLFEGLEF